MKVSIVVLPAMVSLAAARDNIFNFDALIKARSDPSLIRAREVPQEHSHEKFLRLVSTSLALNNPDQILDPVFGLLGAKAAAGGSSKITDVACLQQATADQAFTNAKAKQDVQGMTAALVYRALERNSGGVGVVSPPCTSIKAKNPEIAALSQHQDPASTGAAALNKQVTLDLAKQIDSIGGDPLTAIQSGTFKPGNTNDLTGKGNTCDDQNDAQGCIFTQNLLVPDVTAQEIQAALKGQASGAAASTSASAVTAVAASTPAAAKTVTVNHTKTVVSVQTVTAACTAAASSPVSSSSSSTSSSSNLQTFTGSLGGLPAPILNVGGGRPFQVAGNTFTDASTACQRSCDKQHNSCASQANAGTASFKESDCETQQPQCQAFCVKNFKA